MKKTIKLVGIIAVVAVIGFSMTACDIFEDNNTSKNNTSNSYTFEFEIVNDNEFGQAGFGGVR